MKLPSHYYTSDIIRATALKLDETDARMINRGLVKALLHHAVRLEGELAAVREVNAALMARLLQLRKEKEQHDHGCTTQ